MPCPWACAEGRPCAPTAPDRLACRCIVRSTSRCRIPGAPDAIPIWPFGRDYVQGWIAGASPGPGPSRRGRRHRPRPERIARLFGSRVDRLFAWRLSRHAIGMPILVSRRLLLRACPANRVPAIARGAGVEWHLLFAGEGLQHALRRHPWPGPGSAGKKRRRTHRGDKPFAIDRERAASPFPPVTAAQTSRSPGGEALDRAPRTRVNNRISDASSPATRSGRGGIDPIGPWFGTAPAFRSAVGRDCRTDTATTHDARSPVAPANARR